MDIAALVILVAIAAYAILIYNRLVKARQTVRESWSGIEVQLKRRSNLIPNLVETVKGYAAHEKDTLAEVTESRAAVQRLSGNNVKDRAAAESLLSQAIGKLFAVAEDYPDLKANENFIQLQGSLETAENEIQMSRRYFNGAVKQLNVLIESFPSNLIANTFGFQLADYFELEDPADAAVPQVSF